VGIIDLGEVDRNGTAGVADTTDDPAAYRLGRSETMVFLAALDAGLAAAAGGVGLRAG